LKELPLQFQIDADEMAASSATGLSHSQVNISTFDQRNEIAEFEWQRFRVEKICSILRTISNKETVADLGCLSGMATALYSATGIKTLHAFDISQSSLSNVRAKGFEGYYWNADGGRCPMPDNTYDLLIAGEIIEHLVDTDHFAEEAFRILKPGGYLVLSTPNLASWYNRVRLLRGLVPACYPGPSSTIRKNLLIDNNHIRVNVLSEWTNFLQCHRFHIEDAYGSSHLQGLEGGWRTGLLKFIDRVACRRPTLSTDIILVARRP
jgi:2-polyprenyl-3-methyl-5-hydroxy-6-metoxy-1,4-benzoquinol methylase